MPSIAISNSYEAVYIINPDLGDAQIEAITGKYKGLIESNGGTVDKIAVWSPRKLAYEIKGRTEGIYVIMQFTAFPKVEAELRRIFQISEDQFRYMIIRPDATEDPFDGDRRGGRSDDQDSAPSAPVAAAPVAVAPEVVAAPIETAPVAETVEAAPVAETAVEAPVATAEPLATAEA